MGRLILNAASAATESHKLVKHTHFVSNVTVTESQRNRKDIWRCSFTKKYGADKSYLVVEGHLNGTGMYNYPVIGQYVTIDHFGIGTSPAGSDARGFGGIVHCGPDANNSNEQFLLLIQKVFKADDLSPDPHPNMQGTFPSSQLGAGSHSLDIGLSANTGCKYGYQLCESAASFTDARRQQSGGFLSIMEFVY
tara:strand:- start:23 stop:601 length:579 start_codon:yes stop_codon:yes gene_type:complete